MPLNFNNLSVDMEGLNKRKKSLPKDVKFFTDGIHPVKVKEVSKKTSAKGRDYFMVDFYSGSKTIKAFLFLPDGKKKYNPDSSQAKKLEQFLNATVNAGISPDSDDYMDKLVAGLELFNTPRVFAEKECKIKVGYEGVHVEYKSKGAYMLCTRNGEPLFGDATTYPTREAAALALEQINSKRGERDKIKLNDWREVLQILMPDTPNKVEKIVRQDSHIDDDSGDDEDDEDTPF